MGCLARSSGLEVELARVGEILMMLRPNRTLFLFLSIPPGADMKRLSFHAHHMEKSKSNFGKRGMLAAWPDLEIRK